MRLMQDVKIISDAINYLLRFKSKMILSCSNGWADLKKHQAMNMVHYPFSRIIYPVVFITT